MNWDPMESVSWEMRCSNKNISGRSNEFIFQKIVGHKISYLEENNFQCFVIQERYNWIYIFSKKIYRFSWVEVTVSKTYMMHGVVTRLTTYLDWSGEVFQGHAIRKFVATNQAKRHVCCLLITPCLVSLRMRCAKWYSEFSFLFVHLPKSV
jgi:hypothetical protein